MLKTDKLLRNRKTTLIALAAVLVCGTATALVRWRTPPPVQWTLERKPGTSEFLLKVKNNTDHKIGVFLDEWCYEVVVRNIYGFFRTDRKAFEARVNRALPFKTDFALLPPGKSAQTELRPYLEHGTRELDMYDVSAECIRFGSENWRLLPPDVKAMTDVEWVHLERCGPIRL